MIKTIPLAKLVPSPRNMRRHFDAAAALELEANIAARGLLQNLVVSPAAKPKGRFAVEAGERRRRALVALVEDGKLDKAFEVPCLVLSAEPETGLEASLAENFQRLAMNPADECLAFQSLVAAGADAEGIARRFGLTIRFVEGRLRLADLAPVVFEALGAGEIGLEVAKAYAATPDRERQAWVFEQLGRGYSSNHPDSIRRLMTQATASATDRRARFIGEQAYLAAGGRIEGDLFSEDAAVRWLDVPLLERLAGEKLEEAAAAAAAEHGLAFVRPTLDSWVGHTHLAGLYHVPAEIEPLSEEEDARIAALEGEIESLVEVIEDEQATAEMREKAEQELDVHNRAIRAIVDKLPVLDADARATAGTFMLLGDDGHPCLYRTFYTEKAPDEDNARQSKSDDAASSAPASKGPGVEPAPCTRPALSQRLKDELSIQRRDILAAHIAASPSVALDLAIFLMIDPVDGYTAEPSGSALLARHPADPVHGFEIPDAKATLVMAQAWDALDRSWSHGDTRADRFDAFRAMSDADRMAWLAVAVARTLEVSLGGINGASCPLHDRLAQLLDIEVARWWRPTGATWFDKVSKASALEALTEVGGPSFAARYAKARKAELSESCERIFAGEFVGEASIKQAAMAWLPDVMRFAGPAPEPTNDSDPLAETDPVVGSALETPPWEDAPEQESGDSIQERIEEAA